MPLIPVTFVEAPGGAAVGYGTALPGSPSDGDEYILVDSTSAPTYQWRFRYNAGSSSAYKWEFVGGASAYSEVVTSQSLGNTNYSALATAGPSVTLPVEGDYDVAIGCFITTGQANFGLMSYDIGGTGAVDADAMRHDGVDANDAGTYMRTRRKTALGAVTLTAKYKTFSGTPVPFSNRWMSVTPVRVA